MSKLKKIASVMLAAIMVLAMTCTAFAADTYSITISNAKIGETYKVYKLFDATYADTDNDGIADLVSYTIDTNTTKGKSWYDLINVSGSPFTFTSTTTSGVYTVTKASNTVTSSTITEWLATQTSLPDEDYTVDATTTSETVSVSGAGYYYITTTTGSLVTLDSATPTVTVEDKNGTTIVTKQVQEDSTGSYGDTSDADVTQTVTFQSTISNINGATNLILHDEMENLSYKSIASVVYHSSSSDSAGTTLNATSDYTVRTSNSISDDCTFEIDFSDSFESSTLKSASNTAYIVVTYTADLTEGAINSKGENDTWVTYGNAQTSEHDNTNTYTYGFNIYKYTGSGTNIKALSGAKFVLSKLEGTTTYYATITNGILTGWTDVYANATTLVSDSSGNISISGLDADTYTLTETEAPTGYNLLEAPITIDITGNKDSSDNLTGNCTIKQDGTEVNNATINVVNNSGSELPDTGGIGTTIFYIIGGVLVLGAAVLLITRKRMGKTR